MKWVKADFSGIMGQLDSGPVDSVANAVAVTDERKSKYQFSTPYSYIGSQIVTSDKNKEIKELKDSGELKNSLKSILVKTQLKNRKVIFLINYNYYQKTAVIGSGPSLLLFGL